jgi:adenylylsulfate kinase
MRHAHEDKAAVIWLTGLSGSGKSTIADRLAAELERLGCEVEKLDGDMVREVFPTGFSREERHQHVRRMGFVAGLLNRHGVFVVASFISPYRESRDFARSHAHRFFEIHIATPLSECERRDVKGLYARARRGEIKAFTGISDSYEPPLCPELTLDTTNMPVEQAVRQVLDAVLGKDRGA